MSVLSIDYRLGYRYADEALNDMSVRQIDVLVAGLPKWKESTAEHLIAAALQRKADGINPAHQDGVIARARLEQGRDV